MINLSWPDLSDLYESSVVANNPYPSLDLSEGVAT